MGVGVFLKYFWRSVCVVAVVLYLSFAPLPERVVTGACVVSDKLVHFLMYMGLTMFLVYDFWKYSKGIGNSCRVFSYSFLSVCFVFPVLLGGLAELAQECFFKPRSADWFDWFADILGVMAALLLMNLLALFLRALAENRLKRKKN